MSPEVAGPTIALLEGFAEQADAAQEAARQWHPLRDNLDDILACSNDPEGLRRALVLATTILGRQP